MTSYLLTVLGNGRPAYLARTLAAIDQHLTPAPGELVLFDDSTERLGQCGAQARVWAHTAASGFEYVLHFEEDYVLLRPVDVRDMIALMEAQPHLLALTLMRTPWGAELEFGGFVPQSPGHYERKTAQLPTGVHPLDGPEWREVEWIETTRNWSNAPTLFRTELAREFEWPAVPGCETMIGPQMLERYPEGKFALWGSGSCDVAHIGVVRGEGYHGY